MYVNERTLDYGESGRKAVRLFLSEGQKIGMIDPNLDTAAIEFNGAE